MITIIVAYDEGRVIGNNGSIPWRLPEDFKLFKKRTTNQVVIMGKKTYLSLPDKFRPLPNRQNIVLSRRAKTKKRDGWFSELEDSIDWAKSHVPDKEIFIIGGEQIYRLALEKNVVDKIIVSKVHGNHEGDTFFPELEECWKETSIEKYEGFDVVCYER